MRFVLVCHNIQKLFRVYRTHTCSEVINHDTNPFQMSLNFRGITRFKQFIS